MGPGVGTSPSEDSPRQRPLSAPSRRSFLIRTGTLAAGVGAVSGTASASHADAKPDHVTISFDRAWLDQYRPLLDLRNVPNSNRPTLYGWRASSPEYDTEVAVFACGYAVQSDTWALSSHAGDHEWIYVFVDPVDGSVQSVSYTAYHWLKGGLTRPNLNLDETGGGEHPTFTVADTYHHYYPNQSSTGALLSVQSLGDVDTETGPLYRWLANGMEQDLARGTVHRPWLMRWDSSRDSWWSRDGISTVNRWIVSAWAFAGVRGADVADRGEVAR